MHRTTIALLVASLAAHVAAADGEAAEAAEATEATEATEPESAAPRAAEPEASIPPGSSSTAASLAAARAAYDARRLPEAKRLVEAHLAANPDDVAAWRLIHDIALASRRPNDSWKALQRIVALDPRDRDARLALAGRPRITAAERAKLLGEAHALAPLTDDRRLKELLAALDATDAQEKALAVASHRATVAPGASKAAATRDLFARARRIRDVEATRAAAAQVLALSPDDRDALEWLTRDRLGAKDDTALAPLAKSLEKLGTKDEELAVALADWARDAAKDARAELHWLELAAGGRSGASVQLRLGRALVAASRPREGVKRLLAAEKAGASLVEADREAILRDVLAQGKSGDAEAKALLEIAPTNPLGRRVRGQVLASTPSTRASSLPDLEAGRASAEDDAAHALLLASVAKDAGDHPKAERYVREHLAASPTSAPGHRLLAALHEASGARAAQIDALTRAASADPSDGPTQLTLAQLLAEEGRTQEATAALLAAAAHATKDSPWAPEVGIGLVKLGRAREAEPLLKTALAAKPSDVELLAASAACALELGDAERAAKEAERGLEFASGRDDLRRTAGIAATVTNRFDRAVKVLADYTKFHPDDAEATSALGRARLGRGEVEQAIPLLERAGKSLPNHLLNTSALALAFARLERWSDASEAGERAVALGSKSPRLLTSTAYAHHRAGHAEKADALVKKAEALGIRNTLPLLIQGERALQALDFPKARAAFEQALKDDPTDGVAHFGLAKIAFEQKQDKTAYDHLVAAVADAPRNALAQEMLGRLALTMGKPKVARKAFAAVPMDKNAELLTLRGKAEVGAGDPRAAEQSFRSALEADPKNYAAAMARAENAMHLPHTDKAREHYEQAAALRPNDPEPLRKLFELSKESGDAGEQKKAAVRLEFIEVEAASARRKTLAPDEVVTVGIANFQNASPSKVHPELALGIPEELTVEFSRVGRIDVLDRLQLAQRLEKLNDQLGMGEAVGLDSENFQQVLGKIQGMRMAVVGSYQVVGENITISARILDETGKVKSAAKASGKLAERGKLQRNVAYELAGVAVPLDDADKKAFEQEAKTSDLSALSKFTEGRKKELMGEIAAARALYREAMEADEENPALARQATRVEQSLRQRVRLGLHDFRAVSAPNAGSEATKDLASGLREAVATQLAASGAVTIIEDPALQRIFQEEMKLVADEDPEKGSGFVLDPATMMKLDADLRDKLQVSAYLIGSYAAAGDTIRVTGRLRDAAQGKDLVVAVEEGKVGELLEVEERLAEKLLRALVGDLSEAELARMKHARKRPRPVRYVEEEADEPIEIRVKKRAAAGGEDASGASGTGASASPEPVDPSRVFHAVGYRARGVLPLLTAEPSYGALLLQGAEYVRDGHDHADRFAVMATRALGGDAVPVGVLNWEKPTLSWLELSWERRWHLQRWAMLGGKLVPTASARVGAAGLFEQPAPQSSGWTDGGLRITGVLGGSGGLRYTPWRFTSIGAAIGASYTALTPAVALEAELSAAVRF
jgi:Tfp pilus assembly protein PilF/TolB-like protein